MKRISRVLPQKRSLYGMILAIVLSLIVGSSYLVIDSQFSPVYILVAIVALIAVLVWINQTSLALFFALFIVFLPNGLLPASLQSLLNRGMTVFALGIWLVNLMLRKDKMIITSSLIFMLAFLVWSGVTILWSGNQDEALTLFQVYALRALLFILLITNQVNTPGRLNNLLFTMAISGVLLAVISVGTIALQGYSSGSRLKVLDMNENGLGIMLLVCLPMVIWWASQVSEGRMGLRNVLAGGYFLLTMAIIGLSGSRGSAISLGVTLLGFLVFKPTRSWGWFGMFFVGCAVLALPFVFTTTIERFLVVAGDTILGGRENLWPAAWQLIQDHFLLGVGVGNSQFEMVSYLVRMGTRYVSYTGEPIHNPVLVIWTETGIIGLVFYLGILASAVIPFVRQFVGVLLHGSARSKLYYSLVFSSFLGYMASWIKGGGMESDFTYFLMLALLILPSVIKPTMFPTQSTAHA